MDVKQIKVDIVCKIFLTCPSVHQIFDLLTQPFIESIKSRMLLRGIVSYGQYYLSQQLIIGPAFNDTVSNYDRLDWIGIALCPNARGVKQINSINRL
jgi:hypothetical protein